MRERFLVVDFFYLVVTKFREGIDDDTEDDVQTDRCDYDEEGQVEKNADGRLPKVVRINWNRLHQRNTRMY